MRCSRWSTAGRCWVKLSAPYESTHEGAPHYPAVAELARAARRPGARPDAVGDELATPRPGRPARPSAAPCTARQLAARRRDSAGKCWSTTPSRSTVSNRSAAPRPDDTSASTSRTSPTGAQMNVENYARYPSLVDRTVFVTGGADGIGSASRAELRPPGQQGRIRRHQRRVRRGDDPTLRRCRRHAHAACSTRSTCATSRRSSRRAPEPIDDLGGVTVLVNNAASDDRHTWDEMTVEYWNDRLEREPPALLLRDPGARAADARGRDSGRS